MDSRKWQQEIGYLDNGSAKGKGDRRERKNLEEMDDLGHHLLLRCIGCCQKDGMHTPPMMCRPESSEAAAATAYRAKD